MYYNYNYLEIPKSALKFHFCPSLVNSVIISLVGDLSFPIEQKRRPDEWNDVGGNNEISNPSRARRSRGFSTCGLYMVKTLDILRKVRKSDFQKKFFLRKDLKWRVNKGLHVKTELNRWSFQIAILFSSNPINSILGSKSSCFSRCSRTAFSMTACKSSVCVWGGLCIANTRVRKTWYSTKIKKI